MRENFYEKNTANHPRLKTDKFFVDYENIYKYTGFMDDSVKFIEDFQLLDTELWARFVNQFSQPDADFDRAWRCEYWGKMMRGACFVYSYTRNKKLYDILLNTVKELMTCAEDNGRISTYSVDHEFDGWDIWGRKYVLLGMQYFLEICTDDNFAESVKRSMCGQLDYIMQHIGEEEGKIKITDASRNWRGLNSSSLLEPVVRLYSITSEKKYLDFAEYIVNIGGADVANIFELAYQNDFYPYQYPVTKAYEMTSCFEGLLEYYRITGEEKYKTAIVNFANKILESDFTVIGCCGCTHELFDHSTVRQANTTNGETMQETCVTVTLMKFFYQVHLLTGDPKYADAFEISLYNAYLGSINTDKSINPEWKKNYPEQKLFEPLPFDSYSPLTAGVRGLGVGGIRFMSDNHYYGCCACIGAAGIGLVPKLQLLTTVNGFAMNLYISGEIKSETPSGGNITFNIKTDYPVSGKIRIEINMNGEEDFEILLRNPYWSKTTAVFINGEKVDISDGYIAVNRCWENGDEIELQLDMRTEAVYPVSYGTDILMNEVIWGYNYVIPTFDHEDPIAKHHIALRRGPVMLAQENRLGYSVDETVDVKVNDDGYVDVCIPEMKNAPYENIIEVKVPLKDGGYMTVTDYASAGKLWNEDSKMAVWMLTKE